MSLETGVVIGLIVSALLLVGAVWLLYRDGLFKDAKGWINTDDSQWIVETREPVSFKGPATKGFDRKLRAVPSSKSTTLRPPAA